MTGEWRDTTLGQLAEFLSGGTPTKDVPRYWGGAIPWVSAKDMKRFRLDDTEDHVTEEGIANGTKLVVAGTVLLLARGMTLLNDVPICVVRRPMAFNQDVKALRVKPGIRNDFLPYLLLGNKERLLNLVDLAGHGTGRLNSDELKALDVVLPPESAQRAISHILAALDDKVDLNRRMNETLERTARTIFKSWFVDFDPVRAKAEGRQPAGMNAEMAALFPARVVANREYEIPAGWSLGALDENADFLNGLAMQKYPPQGRGTLPVIKIAELRKGGTAGADLAGDQVPGDFIIADGDLLFSWSGSLAVRIWTGGRGALNQHLFKVTSKRCPIWYVYQYLNHHLPEFQAIAAAKATTMGHIQRHHLHEVMIVLPTAAVMERSTAIIGPLHQQCILLRQESRTLATLRDALLPKLLSGEIRIRDAEKLVETHL